MCFGSAYIRKKSIFDFIVYLFKFNKLNSKNYNYLKKLDKDFKKKMLVKKETHESSLKKIQKKEVNYLRLK